MTISSILKGEELQNELQEVAVTVVYLIFRESTGDTTNLNAAFATFEPCFIHFDEKIQDSATQNTRPRSSRVVTGQCY